MLPPRGKISPAHNVPRPTTTATSIATSASISPRIRRSPSAAISSAPRASANGLCSKTRMLRHGNAPFVRPPSPMSTPSCTYTAGARFRSECR
ncbi:hypothetical protein KSP40_PGU014094 [Platanthera guangdongensis]|uniref:Uncharacterized protein n=1 Tax=Platanthera guangdongensis TaxID=2320717 RepID=A0ABR2M2X2_9ASPA